MCPVISGSLRDVSLQALTNFEGPASKYVKLFSGFSHIPGVCIVLAHFMGTLRLAQKFLRNVALSVSRHC